MRFRLRHSNNTLACLLLLISTAGATAKISSSIPVDDATNTHAHHSLRHRRDQTTTTTTTQLLQFQLIDASTGQVVVNPLRNGMTVSLASLGLPESPSLNIVAVDDSGTVNFVKFSNGHGEGGKPFTYCGDVGAGREYNSCDDLKLGMHEISATSTGEGGIKLGISSITFSIQNEEPVSGGVEELFFAFRLVHVPTRQVVADLQQGSVVDLQKLEIAEPSFTIEAVASEQVKAVKFSNNHMEGAAPFYYCGDRKAGSELFLCDDLVLGSHTVSATIFGVGGQIGSYSLTFEIVNGEQEVSTPTTETMPLSNGTWIEVNDSAPLTARHEACFVFDDVTRRAYLIGGRDRGNSYPVDIYDPVTRSWSKGSEPPIELHHMNVSIQFGCDALSPLVVINID